MSEDNTARMTALSELFELLNESQTLANKLSDDMHSRVSVLVGNEPAIESPKEVAQEVAGQINKAKAKVRDIRDCLQKIRHNLDRI